MLCSLVLYGCATVTIGVSVLCWLVIVCFIVV